MRLMRNKASHRVAFFHTNRKVWKLSHALLCSYATWTRLSCFWNKVGIHPIPHATENLWRTPRRTPLCKTVCMKKVCVAVIDAVLSIIFRFAIVIVGIVCLGYCLRSFSPASCLLRKHGVGELSTLKCLDVNGALYGVLPRCILTSCSVFPWQACEVKWNSLSVLFSFLF